MTINIATVKIGCPGILLDLLSKCKKAHLPAVQFYFWHRRGPDENFRRVPTKGEKLMLQLTDTQQVALAIAPVDAAGNPAPVDGAPAWASSDDTVVVVTPSADGLSAVAATTGKLGNAQVTVSADADLGEGVTTIGGALDLSVVAGQAVSLGISAGVPAEKAVPAPVDNPPVTPPAVP